MIFERDSVAKKFPEVFSILALNVFAFQKVTVVFVMHRPFDLAVTCVCVSAFYYSMDTS